MAEILKIDIDEKDLIKSASKSREEIKKLTSEMKSLKDSTEDNSEEYVRLESELKAQKKEYNSQVNLISKYTSIKGKEIKSIDDGRKALAVVSSEWSRQAKLYGENSTRVQNLTNKKTELTSRLKELESATGDNRRNVGNYSDALNDLGGEVESIIPGFGGMKQGALSVNGAFKILLANPIMATIAAIAAAIGGLVKALMRNQEAVDKVNRVMKALSAVFDVVLDRITSFVKAILSGQNVFEALKNAITGVNAEMQEEAKLAAELEKRTQKLRDEEIKFISAKAEKRKEIAKLRLAVKNEQLTEEERIKSLDKAIALEKQIANEELRLARERAAIAKEELARSESSAEDRREYAQLLADVSDKERESLDKQRTIASERLSFIRKLRKQEKKAYDDLLADAQEFTETLLAGAEIMRNQVNENIVNIEDELFNQTQEKQQVYLDTTTVAAQQASENQVAIKKWQKDKEVEIARQSVMSQIGIAADLAGSIGQLAGEGTALAKSAAVAETLINTYKSATAAYAALAGIGIAGPALGAAAAAAATVAGLANLKKIKQTSTKPKKSGGSSGGSSSSSGYSSSIRSGSAGIRDGGATARTQQNAIKNSKEATKQALGEALKEQPPVMVLEDFEATNQRKVRVEQNSEL